ncbi:MAG: dCTP deaminase [Pseudomonas sp.]
MIINGGALLRAAPIVGMTDTKVSQHGVTYGLGEAGFDIRIKQDVLFAMQKPDKVHCLHATRETPGSVGVTGVGRFVLASSIEEFQMPTNLVGIVHDKSTWARRGLSVFNTVIEPGWNGFLTLELVYHGNDSLIIPAGSGIAQVMFHQTTGHAEYSGRYQHQANEPVPAKEAP